MECNAFYHTDPITLEKRKEPYLTTHKKIITDVAIKLKLNILTTE